MSDVFRKLATKRPGEHRIVARTDPPAPSDSVPPESEPKTMREKPAFEVNFKRHGISGRAAISWSAASLIVGVIGTHWGSPLLHVPPPNVSALETKADDLAAKMEELTANVAQLNKSYVSLAKLIGDTAEENHNQIVEANAKVTSIKQELSVVKSDLGTLSDTLRERRADIHDLDLRVAGLERHR